MTSETLKAYLITDPAYYGSTPDRLVATLDEVLQKTSCDMICYRDKLNSDYALMATFFLGAVEAKCPMRLLHGDVELASRLHAEGVHLTSTQFDEIETAKRLGLYVVISCHSDAELQKAYELGADAATYSPVFASPGKGEPRGLEDLKERVGKIPLNIIALGGITTPEHVRQIEDTGAFGFASIRYFVEDHQ
jgi:thiamine-phosphate pyrophosphorylase